MGGLLGVLLCGGPALAQSSAWDAAISNSNWYVGVPNLLAYAAPSTSFANPVPIGDQTLWTLGPSTNGVFAGTSSAQLAIGPLLTSSDSNIQGRVTPDGAITMVFTPTTGGTSTIGLGQMRTRGGVTEMEMQMITGSSLLVSHWAYMLPYDPATFTPPPPAPVPTNASPQWAWTAGTPWRVVSPGLFGSAAPGTFIITTYKNGYFWGQGVGPDGAASGFTVLGSITPEGKVLYNVISNAQLYSLYGTIAGDASTAQMLLGAYDALGTFDGDLTYLQVVRPYGETAAALGNRSALGAAATLYAIAGTEAGLTGAFAPATGVLNALSGSALSAALGQTVPVLAGEGTQATANSQRLLQQVVLDRLAAVRAGDAGSAPGAPMQNAPMQNTSQNAWMRPLGVALGQSARDGAPGSSATGGGFIAGLDQAVSPALILGGFFAYTYTGIDGTTAAIPGSLDVSSYLLGIYGAAALAPGLEMDVRLDLGLNRNAASRTLSFFNARATAAYDGTSGHAGIGLKYAVPLGERLTLTPSVRLDYLQIDTDAYRESGAGALNLAVKSQLYREMFVTSDLKADYRIADGVRVSVHGGVGYNTYGDPGALVASFQGGGAAFATSGIDASPWLFSAGAALVGFEGARWSFGAHYDLQASPSGYLGQMAALSLRLKI
ncbi:autotransporter outer membrane beta-barrel domain-containing protein [Xanthobacter sp. DSM 24535]|uniref:autotransporter family protein n=1 Tax=Roseixanthobacter psychrophilus TaxID=3119917 RepID=UPI00372B1B06